MKKLTQIELYLEKSPPDSEEKEFLVKSRSMCCYLERRLVGLNFETKCSRINIKCVQSIDEASVAPYKNEPYLEVRLPYKMPSIDSMNSDTLQKHYARIIELGLKAAEQYMPVPYEFCIDVLVQFEAGGYVNEWVQAEKTWSRKSLRSVVTAHLTMDEFFLTQQIEHEDSSVEEKIAKAETREILFYPYLGSLSMDRSGDIVYKNKKKIISKYSVVEKRFIL